jgi:hypothetical protein
VTANRGQAAGLDGYVFQAKATTDCVRDGVSVLKLGLTRNGNSKKALWMKCRSGMHSNKAAKRTLAQLIDPTEVDREILSGARFVSP